MFSIRLFKSRICSQQLSPYIFLNQLNTEQYDLLQEVNNQPFLHLASQCHRLLFRLRRIKRSHWATLLYSLRFRLAVRRLILIGFLPFLSFNKRRYECFDDLRHVWVHRLLSWETMNKFKHDWRRWVWIEYLRCRLGDHCVDYLQPDAYGSSFMICNNTEKFEVKDIEICHTGSCNGYLFKQRLAQYSYRYCLNLLEKCPEVSH